MPESDLPHVSRIRKRWPWVALALVLAVVPCASQSVAADRPFVGVAPLDPFAPADRSAARLRHLAGLGAVRLASTPVAWGRLEPEAPRAGGPRYDWDALDEAVLVWQLSGLDPLPVLTPHSPWGSGDREGTTWVRKCRRELRPPEAAALVRAAAGAAPPRSDRWRDWERFVRDLVERYDGDGIDDMPGLRRPVRYVQILARVGTSAAWLGTPDQYLRLLHHAGAGAAEANADVKVVTGALSLDAIGHDPFPDLEEWRTRVAARLPRAPEGVRLEMERQFQFAERLLEMPRLYGVLAHVGSGNHHDDVTNLRYLRRVLDEQGASDVELWLTENPSRKLDAPRTPLAPAVKSTERRVRSRWLPIARNPRHSQHPQGLAWLRRGQAFDLVRSVCHARAAGADAVVFFAPWDDVPTAPREVRNRCARQGLVTQGRDGGETIRTPSWFALRQLNKRLAGHRGARELPAGAGARLVVFSFLGEQTTPWVGVLLADPKNSWAGDPGAPPPRREVAVRLPTGRYRLEAIDLDGKALEDGVTSREVRVREGLLRTTLTPAPVYVIPLDQGSTAPK